MSAKNINIKVKVWRQKSAKARGRFETYELNSVPEDASFLEMLDILNEKLTLEGVGPIAFDHDCREGICGQCGAVVNGHPHGPDKATTLCQNHMRSFKDGDTIVIEPFRARAFPVIKDLAVDRAAFDRVTMEGGYITTRTGSSPDANAIPIPKEKADLAMDAAQCIGCGSCVAACPNASAMLYVGAKVGQYSLLPQGQVERERRVINMVKQMDAEGFGNCSNEYECAEACPKEINVSNIARMNREFLRSYSVKGTDG